MAPIRLTGLEDFATSPAVCELADGTSAVACVHQPSSAAEQAHVKVYRADAAGACTLVWTSSEYGKDIDVDISMRPGTTIARLWISEAAFAGAPGNSALLDRYDVDIGVAAAGGGGAPGAQGPPGAPGKTILNGTTLPAATTGTTGDFYLNTTTAVLYGPKTATGWGNGISLVGPRGPAGPQGPAGPGGSGGDDPRVAKFAAIKAIADS
jgi:hypothetical protein